MNISDLTSLDHSHNIRTYTFSVAKQFLKSQRIIISKQLIIYLET